MSIPAQQSPSLPRSALRQALDGLETRSVGIVAVSAAALIVSHYQGSTGFFSSHFGERVAREPWHSLLPYYWWFGTSALLYMLVPWLLGRAAGFSSAQLGMGLGDARFGLKASAAIIGLMLPVALLASFSSAFRSQYPFCDVASQSFRGLLLYEPAYAAYFVAWEFLFRGYLLFGLEPKLGRYAVLVQVLPFALMHLGKPEAEALGSIAAGIALGALALRTRSFWYGAIIHIAVAVGMDLCSALPRILAA